MKKSNQRRKKEKAIKQVKEDKKIFYISEKEISRYIDKIVLRNDNSLISELFRRVILLFLEELISSEMFVEPIKYDSFLKEAYSFFNDLVRKARFYRNSKWQSGFEIDELSVRFLEIAKDNEAITTNRNNLTYTLFELINTYHMFAEKTLPDVIKKVMIERYNIEKNVMKESNEFSLSFCSLDPKESWEKTEFCESYIDYLLKEEPLKGFLLNIIRGTVGEEFTEEFIKIFQGKNFTLPKVQDVHRKVQQRLLGYKDNDDNCKDK